MVDSKDCDCGFPEGTNGINCERCALIDRINGLNSGRLAADALVGYVLSVRRQNTLDWMIGMREKINHYQEAIGSPDRTILCRGEYFQISTMREMHGHD